VPYGIFPAQDGSIVVACLTNAFWGRICAALEMPEFAGNPRFDSLEKRKAHRNEVNELIAAFTRHRTVAELVEQFTRHEVPHAPILGVKEALAQPQASARGMVVEVEHEALGTIPIVNRSIRFGDAAQPPPDAPPVLGQHTDDILGRVLGFSPEKIEELRAAKIVA
jgi:crotonobetainyl-CoA:carnitine CoA-transferase CaiB-like acyl-CoA transferase